MHSPAATISPQPMPTENKTANRIWRTHDREQDAEQDLADEDAQQDSEQDLADDEDFAGDDGFSDDDRCLSIQRLPQKIRAYVAWYMRE